MWLHAAEANLEAVNLSEAIGELTAIRMWIYELTRLTQTGIDQIDERAGLVDRKCCAGLRILDRARTIIGKYNHCAAQELWIYRAAMRDYQSLNRRLRPDDTIPQRFDQPINPDVVLPEYDWKSMREKIRAAAHAASDAADDATITLIDHRLSIIHAIERDDLQQPSAEPTLLPPPLTKPATERV
jgi:hypothetical protein